VIHPVLSGLSNHAAKAPVKEATLNTNLEYTFLHPTDADFMTGQTLNADGGKHIL
jgi:hypothetical protein